MEIRQKNDVQYIYIYHLIRLCFLNPQSLKSTHLQTKLHTPE